MVWTLTVYDPTGTTAQGVLAEAHSVRLNVKADRLSSVLSFTVDLESTADVALLGWRNVVKVTDGLLDLGAFFVHAQPTLLAEPGELPGISYTCLSLESWLGGGRVGGAVVYPNGGIEGRSNQAVLERLDPRRFGWQNLDYDDSGWGSATQWGTQASPGISALEGFPAGWPEDGGSAGWIWSRALDGSNRHPAGTSLFRKEVNFEGLVRVYASFDNGGELWADGNNFIASDWSNRYSWRQTYTRDIPMDGPTMFAASVTNDPPTTGDNPGGILVAGFEIEEDGTDGALVFVSDGTWKALDYPETIPGVTAGFIAKTLVDEAKARGALTGLTYDFDDAVDSAAVGWPNEITHSWRVGTTLGWLLEQLTEFGCDFQVTSGGVLRMFVAGGTDLSGTVNLDRVEQASLSGDGVEGNAAIVVTPGGMDEQTEESSVAQFGRIETGATFGTADQPATVVDPVELLLARMGWPRDDGQVDLSEESPQPFDDFNLWDTVSYPARSGTQTGRVVEIDGAQDDADGSVDWTVTVDADVDVGGS